MPPLEDLESIDSRIKEKAALQHKRRIGRRDPNLPVIDASKFADQLAALAWTMLYKVEREGQRVIGPPAAIADIDLIMRQMIHTYDLLRLINGDETRHNNSGYRIPFSFVSLPLVRTMIDGFYNCTAMLNDPDCVRKFSISGYYRMRETLTEQEAAHGGDPKWQTWLKHQRKGYEVGMRNEGFTQADLDDSKNTWPLLGVYLRVKPDSEHKRMLRKLTLGNWKEYSAISHASFDGLSAIVPFIGTDLAGQELRPRFRDAAERHILLHIGRAAGLLLCLITELQHRCRFDGADIDQRISDVWSALLQLTEIRELYDYRYKDLVKITAIALPFMNSPPPIPE